MDADDLQILPLKNFESELFSGKKSGAYNSLLESYKVFIRHQGACETDLQFSSRELRASVARSELFKAVRGNLLLL